MNESEKIAYNKGFVTGMVSKGIAEIEHDVEVPGLVAKPFTILSTIYGVPQYDPFVFAEYEKLE